MIKANELRWGNWVYDTRTVGDRTGLPKVLHPIMVEAINQPEFRYCDPIPLTPEILEKAGFEYFEINKSFQLNYPLGIIFWGRDGEIWLHDEYNDEMGIAIKHLHQLQNLYFALTGEELTINL